MLEAESENAGQHDGGGVVQPDEIHVVGVKGQVGLKEGEHDIQHLDGIQLEVPNKRLNVLENRLGGLPGGLGRGRPAGELGDQLGVSLVFLPHQVESLLLVELRGVPLDVFLLEDHMGINRPNLLQDLKLKPLIAQRAGNQALVLIATRGEMNKRSEEKKRRKESEKKERKKELTRRYFENWMRLALCAL